MGGLMLFYKCNGAHRNLHRRRHSFPTRRSSDHNPDGYCINSSLASWGTKKEYEEQNSLLAMMTKYTDQGYGIVIGEYGVLITEGTVKENTAQYIENFLNNCDLYGYVPMLWDCNNMFDRNEGKIIDDDVDSKKRRSVERWLIFLAML